MKATAARVERLYVSTVLGEGDALQPALERGKWDKNRGAESFGAVSCPGRKDVRELELKLEHNERHYYRDLMSDIKLLSLLYTGVSE